MGVFWMREAAHALRTSNGSDARRRQDRRHRRSAAAGLTIDADVCNKRRIRMSSSSAAAPPARPSRRCSRSRAIASSCSSASSFPRFHIGESLIPETYWVLKRLNMLPKMQASHFVKKYSVQFVNAQRQGIGAVLLLGQQAARVLADLAGGAQRVRPDDARTTPASTASTRTKASACSTCSSRAIAPSA